MSALWITVALLSPLSLLAAPAQAGPAAPRQKGSPYFHTCRHRARVWDECVANTAQGLRPLFVDGIPELGVRPIDPLVADEIIFSEASGKFRVNLKMTNVTMEGFRDYVVTGVRSDLQELTLEISMSVPSLLFRARYHMDGRFLFLALSGDGTCQYNLTDVENVFRVKGHLVRRVSDDALHFRVASLRWTMHPSRGSFRFSAPEGEPSLYSQATSRLLNEQAEESWASFQDAVQKGFAEIFRERINRLMMTIPYRHLFPAGVLPLHLLEIPMDDNEADEYPPLQWTRPPTTSTSTTTTTTTTTTPPPTTTTTTAAPTTPAPVTTTSPTSTASATTPPITTEATPQHDVGSEGGEVQDLGQDEAHPGADASRLQDQVREEDAAPGVSPTDGQDADEGFRDMSTPQSVEQGADGGNGEDIASFDTAFTLVASSSPPPPLPSTTTAPLEDVVFVDKGQERRTEYVVVEAAGAAEPSSTAAPPEQAAEDSEDTTEADNSIPTGGDEDDDQLSRSRDLRGAVDEAPSDASNATDAAEDSLSLAALGQAVGEVAKDILAEAAEVLLEAWKGDATTTTPSTASAEEPTTLSP